MCNFYKNMNVFFVKLAILVAMGIVVIFIGAILYVVFLQLGLFNIKASSTIEFSDVLNFLMYTIIPFVTSISIINKILSDDIVEKDAI
ncbi:hypothetical protein [Arcobacter sp. L]|uniref:hypothetical protein n=1 Tax=Arcobacter sp. L TaxID=944547 RepID=UPI0002295ED3|nr:hypothetical protein [Arcobacter sp. L]BAK72781.1 hypothetical protein ABLL_0906 [Arcobacter sp. L]